MSVITSGYLEGLSTVKDGSIKLVLTTQELDSVSATNLFNYRNKYIKFFISDKEISQLQTAVIDSTKITDPGKSKSSSQRLRNVIYRVWEKSGLSIDFDSFYNREMESLINAYKDQL